jgi:hypothetical protein
MLKKTLCLVAALVILPVIVIAGQPALNHAPVAKNQSVKVAEDKTKAIRLKATDSDRNPLAYTIISGPEQGMLTGIPPIITYTPNSHYYGPDSFTFTVNDGTADSNVAIVSITVTPVNDPPVALNQDTTTFENTALTVTLSGTDLEGSPLSYKIVSKPSHGKLVGTGSNQTYTPNTNYRGPDSFTFKVTDGRKNSNIATVLITVTPINHAPVAQEQSVAADEDTSKAITLVATDADGDPLTFNIVTQPGHGTLSGTPPSVIYTPSSHYSGSDSFTFKANDGKTDSNPASVSISVTHVNHPPVAQSQSVSTDEDASRTIVLVAKDSDGDPLTYQIVNEPGHGTLGEAPPDVTYRPAAGYRGSDSFTFKANDGKSDSNIAMVSVTVTPINHAPVAQDQSIIADEDTLKAMILGATDTDGDRLTFQIMAQPAHGTLAGVPPNVTYMPAADYNGPDSFTFKANDGRADSNPATVSISVVAVNDPPVARDQSVTTDENTPKVITLAATDVDGDSLTYSVVAQPIHGLLSGTPPSLTYTPTANYDGLDSFVFKANDGRLDSNVGTVSITIPHVNHPPVAQNQSVTTDEDASTTIILFATDADGDSLTYQIVASPGHGAVAGTPPAITYTPETHYQGSDSFTFKANDGRAESNIATISFTMTPAMQRNIIITVAGSGERGYSGDDGLATEARLAYPRGIAADSSGSLYIADSYNSRIRKVYPGGFITTVAGGGIMMTDGGLATEARLFSPIGVAVDFSNNIYIVDQCRIRKVDTDGIITTVAGDTCGDSGDGGPAIQAQLLDPSHVAVDAAGNLYIADTFRVRKVDVNGIITTVAGDGQSGYSGDGGPATEASFMGVRGVALDVAGNLYIADQGNNRIRKVDTNGIITTIAGSGMQGYEGDGGPATEAKLYRPLSVAVDVSGNLYIADDGNNCIRKVEKNGIITTIAGNGTEGYGGDNGPATLAQLRYPSGVATDVFGNLYIADRGNNRVRGVKDIFVPEDTFNIIVTAAGNGIMGYSGDGGPSTEAQLSRPTGVAVDASNNLYIADYLNHRVRKVDANGMITLIAGNGTGGYSGDGRLATEAELYYPSGVAVDALGNLYIADNYNSCIRKVDRNGIITTVAGNGDWGYRGDGGPATQAQLNSPTGLVVDVWDNLYIADQGNHCIRRVDRNGIITTIAGNGTRGYAGDGGPAVQAELWYPSDIATDALHNFYIVDWGNGRIRKVDANGIITTVAGNGISGYGGNGVAATQTSLDGPNGVAVDHLGNLYIADTRNHLIRKVNQDGIITTIVGCLYMTRSGYGNYWGDGGPAIRAALNYPIDVAVNPLGELYIADRWNDRIRVVMPQRSTITGRVTDSATGLPLLDAMVTIKDSLRTFTTKTNSDGTYAVSGLNQGSFSATFSKPGYRKETVNGTLATDENQTLNIQLTSVPPLTLTITSPQNDATLNSSPIAVVGTMSNGAIVTVNGIQASLGNDSFSVSIPLSEGLNTVTATATDQYGQTVSQSIHVTLISKGIITGMLTDASTNLALPAATVSVTDSSNFTRTALTDNNGTYTITDIPSGAFAGSMTKGGYTLFNFTGTMSPGETLAINGALTPIPPIISNVAVSGLTSTLATITWTTDQLADSYVPYGTTLSYGSWVADSTLTSSHRISLTNLISGTVYHFRVVSTNSYGFSSSSADLIFETQSPLLTLVITSPTNGATINRPDIMVKGTVSNQRGNETGVTVNGKVSIVMGNEFVANHIGLEGGTNTIQATATDTEGNTASTSIIVDANTTGEYISITANTESGISPFEVMLTIDSSLDLTNATLTYTGPGEVEFLSRTVTEYRVRLTAEGIYYFTVSIDSGGNLYRDTIGIVVLSESELDALLRSKWEAMILALANRDTEGSLFHFSSGSRGTYRTQFSGLASLLPEIVSELSRAEINMISVADSRAEYELLVEREGRRFSFHLEFVKDTDGVWRIGRF